MQRRITSTPSATSRSVLNGISRVLVICRLTDDGNSLRRGAGRPVAGSRGSMADGMSGMPGPNAQPPPKSLRGSGCTVIVPPGDADAVCTSGSTAVGAGSMPAIFSTSSVEVASIGAAAGGGSISTTLLATAVVSASMSMVGVAARRLKIPTCLLPLPRCGLRCGLACHQVRHVRIGGRDLFGRHVFADGHDRGDDAVDPFG
jgi:hypothetical protein